MRIVMKKNKKSDEVTEKDIISPQEQSSRQLLESLEKAEREMQSFYDEMTAAEVPEKFEDDVHVRLRSSKRTSANILKAYQHSAAISDELSARWNDLTKGKKRKIIPSAPANSLIDLAESRANHFAQGLSIYKLMLVCFIGSFAGVVIEMLWCLLTRGYIESRAGLVYGPFNLLYGFGAVVLTLALYKFRNKGKWISFLGGMLVGSAVEYFCSWLQEAAFGSRSWDYSRMPFNINGRICLLYSAFWGILGVLWIKVLYPWMAKLILKIPNRTGRIVTWLLIAFLAVNAAVTVIATLRWSQRVNLVEPSNPFWEFIDLHFTNERMERIFANMKFN